MKKGKYIYFVKDNVYRIKIIRKEPKVNYDKYFKCNFVKAIKNEDDTWNLEGEINDTYDFTEFKDLKEYVDNKEEILTDIFSTLFNNFGVVSYEYGVIKKYDVRGGPQGDGTDYYVYKFSEKNGKFVYNTGTNNQNSDAEEPEL